MKYVIALLSAALVGCEQSPMPRPDQCLRAQLFKECMQILPKGPERIHNSNDWDEVVDACARTAYYNSLRNGGISPECSL